MRSRRLSVAAGLVGFVVAVALSVACGRTDLTSTNGIEGASSPAGKGGGGATTSPTFGGAMGGVAASGGEGAKAAIGGRSGEGGLVTAGAGGVAGAGGGAHVPSGSVRLHEFDDYQVLQRRLGASMQVVRIGATFSGSPVVSVQAQVVDFATGTTSIVPWTPLGDTGGASYSGTLEVPEGGWYRTVVRALDEAGNEIVRAIGSNRWGVGINILCIGQSNMVGHGGNAYTIAGELAGLYSNDGAWKHLVDPYDRGGSSSDIDFDYGSGASLVPSLVNALSEYLPGLPIGIIPAAKGSSPLACSGSDSCWAYRNPDDPADVSTLYGNSLAKARRVGGVELIVMHQGETDATNSTTRATYASELARLAANYREDLGDVPLFMCQLGRSTTDISAKNRTDATMQAIRAAQHDSDDPPRVYLAATAIDLDVDGTDHYVKPTLDELGRRMAAAIAHHYRAVGAPSDYRGPQIGSVSYADDSRTVIDVHLIHRAGRDFTPADGIEGFVVLDDGTPVRLASVRRKDASTIRLDLEVPLVGSGAVRYLYGKLPVQTLSNAVHDDSRLALPLEPTADEHVLPALAP